MLGLPLKFILAPGQSSEIKYAPELIKDIENADILGDKAFDCDLPKLYTRYTTTLKPKAQKRG